MIVRHCRFEDNRAGTGGAIRTYHDLTVESSDFRNNIADTFFGGAIRFSASNRELIVRDSLFENNTVLDGARHGGAIMVDGTGHVTLISGSTFIDNAALDDNGDGGAISLQGDTASIINSTFIGNQSGRSGGAIEFGVPQATMVNVTIVGNLGGASGLQPGAGGGIYKAVDSITVTVLNSIVAGNGVNIGDDPDCSGVFVSGGHNLIGQASSGCSGFVDGTNGDQVGTALAPIDPLLASLEDNGGPTPTLALLPGSPAIDAGNPAGCTDALDDPLGIDQRGQPRPVDGDSDSDGSTVCDIGAFEAAADLVFADRFED